MFLIQIVIHLTSLRFIFPNPDISEPILWVYFQVGLLSGGPTFGGIFFFEIWWAYYQVGLLSGGLTYGILRYLTQVRSYMIQFFICNSENLIIL